MSCRAGCAIGHRQRSALPRRRIDVRLCGHRGRPSSDFLRSASKLLANAIVEIAICLIRLNDLSPAPGYADRIDQIIGRPGPGARPISLAPS